MHMDTRTWSNGDRPELNKQTTGEKPNMRKKLRVGESLQDSEPEGQSGKTAKKNTEPKLSWPSDLLEQVAAVRRVADEMYGAREPITANAVAERFVRAPRAKVQEILSTLENLGFLV